MKIIPRTKETLKQQIADATRLLDQLRMENDPILAPLIQKGEDMIAVAKVEIQILDKLDGITVGKLTADQPIPPESTEPSVREPISHDQHIRASVGEVDD